MRRVITDLVVPGAVGTKPLSIQRTYKNMYSSSQITPDPLAGWTLSYHYSFQANYFFDDGHNVTTYSNTIYCPDGNSFTSGDGTHPSAKEGCYGGPFVDTPPTHISLFRLDGSMTIFAVDSTILGYGNSYYVLDAHAMAEVDPYGIRIDLTYEDLGGGQRRLYRATDPTGRYIQFNYDGGGMSIHASNSTGGIGQTIVYAFSPSGALTEVIYQNELDAGGLPIKAVYGTATYGSPAVTYASLDDPHFTGSMARIHYKFDVFQPYWSFGQFTYNYFSSPVIEERDGVSTVLVTKYTPDQNLVASGFGYDLTGVETTGINTQRTFKVRADSLDYFRPCEFCPPITRLAISSAKQVRRRFL